MAGHSAVVVTVVVVDTAVGTAAVEPDGVADMAAAGTEATPLAAIAVVIGSSLKRRCSFHLSVYGYSWDGSIRNEQIRCPCGWKVHGNSHT